MNNGLSVSQLPRNREKHLALCDVIECCLGPTKRPFWFFLSPFKQVEQVVTLLIIFLLPGSCEQRAKGSRRSCRLGMQTKDLGESFASARSANAGMLRDAATAELKRGRLVRSETHGCSSQTFWKVAVLPCAGVLAAACSCWHSATSFSVSAATAVFSSSSSWKRERERRDTQWR